MQFDFEALSNHVNNDKKLLSDLLKAFSKSYPVLCSNIHSSIIESNFEDLEFNAHSFKGMISNFFSKDLQDRASSLEALGQSKSVSEALVHYEYLSQNIPGLVEVIGQRFKL